MSDIDLLPLAMAVLERLVVVHQTESLSVVRTPSAAVSEFLYNPTWSANVGEAYDVVRLSVDTKQGVSFRLLFWRETSRAVSTQFYRVRIHIRHTTPDRTKIGFHVSTRPLYAFQVMDVIDHLERELAEEERAV